MPTLRQTIISFIAVDKADPLGKLYREAKFNNLPREIGEICYGISYALDTGRLPGKVDYEIRHLKPQKMGKLVCDIYESNNYLVGEIPAILIKMFY